MEIPVFSECREIPQVLVFAGQRKWIEAVIAFAKTVKRYAYGIINHCLYPLHTSGLEGINNKIKVIKRKAYGFHDVEYSSLLIENAFTETK